VAVTNWVDGTAVPNINEYEDCDLAGTMLAGAFITNWKVFVPLPVCPVESTTFTVKVCGLLVVLVGVPVIFPLLSIANPSAVSPVQVNVSGAVPPLAVIGAIGLAEGIATPLVSVTVGTACVSVIADENITMPTGWLLPILFGVSSVTVIV